MMQADYISSVAVFIKNYGSTLAARDLNPKYWPHQYIADWDKLFEIEQWCYRTFKSRNWRNRGVGFGFKRADDYTLFMLRWA